MISCAASKGTEIALLLSFYYWSSLQLCDLSKESTKGHGAFSWRKGRPFTSTKGSPVLDAGARRNGSTVVLDARRLAAAAASLRLPTIMEQQQQQHSERDGDGDEEDLSPDLTDTTRQATKTVRWRRNMGYPRPVQKLFQNGYNGNFVCIW